ncbi:MAG: M16 family metallopeptidase [Blastocatellia bacterium]
MKTHRHVWMAACLLAACALSLTPVSAQKKAAAKTAASAKTINVDYRDIKLKNGLRVLLVEDHSAPVISVAITFDVGSRNERQGRTGFAHLFEHMMFAGSENVGKNEYSLLIETNGGRDNATTSEDRTLYFATVPANQLELLLYLESDRMRGLEVTKAELDMQRNAVQEERRMRLDNQPYGKTGEKFQETMYDNFAYKHSVIGSMEDLNAASLEDVKDFFRVYYAPNNAALALVGDFKTADALAKIRKHFESIPAQPAPPAVDATEPPQTAERRFTVEDPLARLPQVMIGYKGIVSNTADAYAMQVMSQALASGQSSRLYQKLVREKELVAGIFGFVSSRRGQGAYLIQATVAPGKKIEDVEAAIYEEIGKLQQELIADWELEKARNSARRGSIQQLQSSFAVAAQLSQNAVYFNDPALINTQFQKIAAVTREDVRRVANKYLQPAVRTVAITTPRMQAGPARGGN